MKIADLDRRENELIEDFKNHFFFQNIQNTEIISSSLFLDMLCQRRFISLAFTPMYDMAIDYLMDDSAKRIARIILREEYPDNRGRTGTTPSHREDLVSDIITLSELAGLPRSRHTILTIEPSVETKVTLEETLSLFFKSYPDEDEDLFQVRVLTILRFWGEILISTEYGELWKRMSALGLSEDGAKQSIFYHTHFRHDAKRYPLTKLPPTATTHADRLARKLSKYFGDEKKPRPKAVEHCYLVSNDIVKIKLNFYNQFTDKSAIRNS